MAEQSNLTQSLSCSLSVVLKQSKEERAAAAAAARSLDSSIYSLSLPALVCIRTHSCVRQASAKSCLSLSFLFLRRSETNPIPLASSCALASYNQPAIARCSSSYSSSSSLTIFPFRGRRGGRRRRRGVCLNVVGRRRAHAGKERQIARAI